MDVVWDPKKASFNFAKHGVMFSDAATVLDDPYALTIEDRRFNEERFVTVGSDAFGSRVGRRLHISAEPRCRALDFGSTFNRK